MMITVQKHAKIFLKVSVTYHDNAVRIRITDGVSVSLVSINVWRLAGDTLNITCNFLCCKSSGEKRLFDHPVRLS
jgi:hypothetical protein